jgi:serine protease Do
MKKHAWIALGLVACAAIGLAFPFPHAALADAPSGAVATAQDLGRAFSHVARLAGPAVVSIEVERRMASVTANGLPFDPSDPDLFHRFLPEEMRRRMQPRPVPQTGQGSGFLVSADGYVLTNGHVVQDASRIQVALNDGRTLPGRLVGSDAHSDVALLKIEGEDFPFLQFGDSDALDVGQWVVAIGNPYGLQWTVTAGIVSAKGRTRVGINDYEDFIQTDAAINPGNSGGPLLDLQGKVIGINSAIYSRTGGSVGLGFAIPARIAQGVQRQLLATGHVERGFLGVMIQDLTPSLARRFGAGDAHGVLVAEVSDGSPAARARLAPGDVVVKVDGRAVEGLGAFRNGIAERKPGSQVELAVLRDGKPLDVAVTLGRLDEEPATAAQPTADEPTPLGRLGLEVRPLTPDVARELGVEPSQGLAIVSVEDGSPAARAGLQPGDVILEADRKPVASPGALDAALAAGHDDVLLRVTSRGHSRFVLLAVG